MPDQFLRTHKELLQENFSLEKLEAEVRRLWADEPYRQKMQADYAEIRSLLGGGGASDAVARAMINELKVKTQ